MSIVSYDSDSSAVWRDDLEDLLDSPKKKGKKGKNVQTVSKPLPVETQHKGYVLEKARPRAGEDWSWARAGRTEMLYGEDDFLRIIKRHKERSNMAVNAQFNALSKTKQDLVNRLIEEHRRLEKNKNAEWILADVQQKDVKWGWKSNEVRKLQVIVKRVDKNRRTVLSGNGVKTDPRDVKGVFHKDDIIDIDEPMKTKKPITVQTKPAIKRSNSARQPDRGRSAFDEMDDPLAGLGLDEFMPPKRQGGQQQQQQQHPPPPPQHQPPHGAIPVGAIPVNQVHAGMHPPMQQQMHPPYPISARQSGQFNPFTPHPNVGFPLESPPLDAGHWIHPHPQSLPPQNLGRPRARSLSAHGRQPSARRHSMDARRHSRQDDRMDDFNFRVQAWNLHDDDSSVESYHERGSIFSPPPSEGRSFTPPSSPRSYYSDMRRRESLDRRHSPPRRPRYRKGYESKSYRNAEIEPAYTYRDRPGRDLALRRSHTYDDYPVGRAAEPRYLPTAPKPPRIMQRRATEYDTRAQRDLEKRERELDYERDLLEYERRKPKYDRFQEVHEPGRHDRGRYGRGYNY